MIKYILIFVACFTLFSKGFSAQNELSFTPPKNWSAIDPKTLPIFQKNTMGYVGKAKNGIRPSINLTYEEISIPFDEYLKIVDSQRDADPNSSWKKLGILQTPFGKANLSEICIKTTSGDMSLLQAIWHKDKIVYVMTGACLKEEFMLHYKEFVSSFESLNLTSVK
ncbi:MAG: hypothetical protein HZB76_02075 [Chlamydiae bacterium]|nr:hypothetical protein [Chlamydiota bacterium]